MFNTKVVEHMNTLSKLSISSVDVLAVVGFAGNAMHGSTVPTACTKYVWNHATHDRAEEVMQQFASQRIRPALEHLNKIECLGGSSCAWKARGGGFEWEGDIAPNPTGWDAYSFTSKSGDTTSDQLTDALVGEKS